MTHTSAKFRLILLVVLIGTGRSIWAQGKPPTDPVAVSSTSSAEYEQQKFGPGAPKPESYLFFQGTFYGGTTKDSNLEKTQFDQIIRILAENMVRQNYFPSKDPKNADLLIVVHWGTTIIYTNPRAEEDQEEVNKWLAIYNGTHQGGPFQMGAPMSAEQLRSLYGDTTGENSTLELNAALAALDADRAQMMRQIGINAKLLGFNDQLAKDRATGPTSSGGMSAKEKDLLLALSEERYFVILMAYDYHTMKKGSTPKLLWSTRFSIRAPGNFFTAALPVMSKVAADYFGHAIDGLKVEKPDLAPKGKVELGQPQVVGNGK